ncbi:MAG: LytR/AlgR family response regulator transcription factor [Rubrivivax sp.]
MNPAAHPRALLAEDEPLLAQALAADIRQLWPSLQWVAQVADGDSAWQQALALKPDVLFLDIRMPGRSGLEVARDLADDWPDATPFPLMVFVTAYDQYALEAFDAQAVDYIVKPAQKVRLQSCVQRLQQRLSERRDGQPLEATLAQLRHLLGAAIPPVPAAAHRLEVIQAGVGSTVHLVPIDEVIYFEAADKYIRVVTAEREHLIRLSLKELLPQLDAQRFWQVHRGTVVQARCITQARRDDSGRAFLSLKGRPETLTVSRLYAHLFKGM